MDERDPIPTWQLADGRTLALDRPRVIAILNATPDSFSDGGEHLDPSDGAVAAAAFVRSGAAMLDVGGESTRPGAARVSVADQVARVVPVIRAVRNAGIVVPISIDTTRSEVARAALDAGADAINDVSGGEDDPVIIDVAARAGCGLVLMHRLRPPGADAYSDSYASVDEPAYGDVVAQVAGSLASKAEDAVARGVSPGAIVLDPGLGFGKTVDQNLDLVRASAGVLGGGYPVLGAASRKSFVGRVSMGDGEAAPPAPADRLGASIAFSLAQLACGVRLFRVHDVGAQVSALRASWRLLGPVPAGPPGN